MDKQSPPHWAQHFFRWFCHPSYYEDLAGDLVELYDERVQQDGTREARWKYIRDVLLLFRPSIIRPVHTYSTLIHPAMFRNYLKVSLRNLWKYKSYALLNIFGLAVGIAASIVLFLIVRYEQSFDTFHAEHEQVYRLGQQENENGKLDTYDATPVPVVPTLLEEIPEVVSGTRYFAPDYVRLRYQDNVVNPLVHFVDSGFVDVFTFETVAGDLRSTLKTENYIALTRTIAEELFGNADPIGKTLEVINNEQRFVVGAVLKNLPDNSSLQFEVLLPWNNAPDWVTKEAGWEGTFMTSFVKLNNRANTTELSDKLLAFKNRHYVGERAANLQLYLRPLAKLRAFDTKNTPIIVLLSIIAAITLLIASVNFTNLATAQSLLRTREIGLRKAIGSLRSQLIAQFLMESVVTCLFALVVGMLLVHLVLPRFNQYFDLSLTFRYWQNLPLLGTLLAIGLITGLLAGAYPAAFVSRLSPITSLRGQNKFRTSGRIFQRGLIVVQYVASILLIAGTLIIWRQVQFMKSQDLQFDEENVVAFSLRYDNYSFKSEGQAKSAIKTMVDRLKSESVVTAITFAEKMPGRYNYYSTDFRDSELPNEESTELRWVIVGNEYFETLGMNLVAGRPFSANLPSDSNAVIINETAAKALGWQDVQDKYLVNSDGEHLPVVGLVKDYHYQSLQDRIQPMLHYYYPGDEYYYGEIAVRLQPGRTAEGLAVLESAYQSLDPFEPFSYYFLDEEFDKMYRAQERLGLTASVFAGIAVVLASLGLLGLAAFATRQRRKEVGVRKVMGASVTQIIVLLSRNFAGLVAIAFVVACPLVYYGANQFLQDFAYRISLGADVFLIAGIIAFVIAGISVSLQAFRAASVNPVNSLRDE
ncbi:ABC transporter permease [Tunicatimonas pelagia]|uniref:ABC transporter permease n=1 Tax=Tunicatimonas pelagia TaxID=931531 RepID=UPI002666A792|nr:ABC transporter permease [Tunicatimonas pelagia]WKN45688.1 ABC transporter permease [Tunicatimonas pelagia]